MFGIWSTNDSRPDKLLLATSCWRTRSKEREKRLNRERKTRRWVTRNDLYLIGDVIRDCRWRRPVSHGLRSARMTPRRWVVLLHRFAATADAGRSHLVMPGIAVHFGRCGPVFRFRMAFPHPVAYEEEIKSISQLFLPSIKSEIRLFEKLTLDRIPIDEAMTWPVEVLMLWTDGETCRYKVPIAAHLRHYWTPGRNSRERENVADWRRRMMMTGG